MQTMKLVHMSRAFAIAMVIMITLVVTFSNAYAFAAIDTNDGTINGGWDAAIISDTLGNHAPQHDIGFFSAAPDAPTPGAYYFRADLGSAMAPDGSWLEARLDCNTNLNYLNGVDVLVGYHTLDAFSTDQDITALQGYNVPTAVELRDIAARSEQSPWVLAIGLLLTIGSLVVGIWRFFRRRA